MYEEHIPSYDGKEPHFTKRVPNIRDRSRNKACGLIFSFVSLKKTRTSKTHLPFTKPRNKRDKEPSWAREGFSERLKNYPKFKTLILYSTTKCVGLGREKKMVKQKTKSKI